MARATSGLGQFRGKVGSVVFRVNQGQQIASAYQPAVKNPKSNLQTAQRNKMYLASQISKLVPREDIIGLAPRGTASDRRNMFVRNILDNSISTLNGELFNTRVNSESLTFSNGNSYTPLDGTVNNGAFSLSIDVSQIEESEYNRLAIKIVQLDISNNVFSSFKSSWIKLPDYDTAVQETITINLDVTTVGSNTLIYAIPVTLNDGYRISSEKKTLVQVDNNGDIVITGEYAISSAVLYWWKSKFIGSTSISGGSEIVPPTTDGNQVVNPDGPNFPNLNNSVSIDNGGDNGGDNGENNGGGGGNPDFSG